MTRTYVSRMTRKGQVTIPAELRKELGLKEGDRVEFVRENGSFRVQRAESVVARLAGSLSSYASGRAIDPDEIHQIVEEGVAHDYMRRMNDAK